MTETPEGAGGEPVNPYAPPTGAPLPPYSAPGGWQQPPPPPYAAPPGAGQPGQPQVPPIPGPYGQQPGWGGGYGYYPPQNGTNGFAIAALVCSIVLSIVCIGSILGIVFGIIGLRQCNERGQNGRGLAIAGIVIGAVAIVGWIVLISLTAATGHSSSNSNSFGALLLGRPLG